MERKIKSGRKSLVKKGKKEDKKKTGPKKKERVPFCQERKKLSLWKRQVLAGLHAVQISNKKSPANQNLPHIMFKTRFPFLYASTSLDTKTLTIASNRNFESCMSIRCLAPQPGSRFFPFLPWFSFASGIFGIFERSRYKKRCQQWVTFPGKSWSILVDARRSRCPIGLRFQEETR